MAKGFTLIELLVVIAILVVLSVAVVLVLNPAELIKQGRDATRISDLAAINSAISLFVADVNNPSATDWVNLGATGRCTSGTVFPGGGAASCVVNASATTTGAGWVAVNFTAISSGSPLSRLPIDPINDSASANCAGATPTNGCFYAYKSGALGVYEIDANMESLKYSTNLQTGVEANAKDGGNHADWYEVGTNLNL